jgi:hypothetical protein
VTGNADESNFATLLVYLGGNKNTLSVRVDTKDRSGNGGAVVTGDSAGSLSGSINAPVSLTEAQITTKMTGTPSSLDGADVCDLDNIDLQKWVLLSIVLNNKTCDVYMDGKLTRSCVLDNVVNVPRGPLKLRLGEMGGFGGRYASVQMWNQQLTPDVIYGIYQMGPTQVTGNIFTDIAKYLGLNVRFTGPEPPNMQANQESCAGQDMMAFPQRPDWLTSTLQQF